MYWDVWRKLILHLIEKPICNYTWLSADLCSNMVPKFTHLQPTKLDPQQKEALMDQWSLFSCLFMSLKPLKRRILLTIYFKSLGTFIYIFRYDTWKPLGTVWVLGFTWEKSNLIRFLLSVREMKKPDEAISNVHCNISKNRPEMFL